MKRIVSMMVVAAMLMCVFAAVAEDMTVYNVNEWVSLRKTASTSADRLAKVPKGATVTDCTKAADGFIECTYKGQTGFVLAKYLKAAPVAPSYKDIADQKVVNVDEWVSLRKTASTSADRLAKVPKGATVTNCSSNGTWVECEYKGQTGYVLAKYLKAAPVAPSYKEIADQKVVNVNEWVSLRKTASTSADRLAKVPKGATVINCFSNGTWVECEYEGQIGYVLAKYLKADTTPAGIPDQEVTGVKEWVSLRKTASTSATRLAEVPLGEIVTNCTKSGSWVKCEYNGKTGYVLAKYLKNVVVE